MIPPVVAWLYVPASRPELVQKARRAAPAIVVDLEDAVHPSRRGDARATLADALLSTSDDTLVAVRVNPVGSPDFADDVACVAPLVERGLVHVVRGAKIESVDDAAAIVAAFGGAAVVCQLESAQAVLAAYDIARVDGVDGLMLGEGDLRADLGLPRGAAGDAGLAYARQTLVAASRAAGLGAPVGAAFTNVVDEAGLIASSSTLQALGFFGRSCLHPRQVAPVRAAFQPPQEDIAWARSILAAGGDMDAEGNAALALEDGSFIDPAIERHARSLLAQAEAARA